MIKRVGRKEAATITAKCELGEKCDLIYPRWTGSVWRERNKLKAHLQTYPPVPAATSNYMCREQPALKYLFPGLHSSRFTPLYFAKIWMGNGKIFAGDVQENSEIKTGGDELDACCLVVAITIKKCSRIVEFPRRSLKVNKTDSLQKQQSINGS